MDNNKIAKSLELMADLMEFQGANAFRLRAYRNGSRVIRDLPEQIADMIANDQDLTQIDGIGKSTAEKCKELVETGQLKKLEEIKAEVPESVLGMLRVPNLGAKKAAKLFNELNIETLDQLKAACEAGEVAKLDGFGEKTQQIILDGLEIAADANKRIYWSEADAIANQLREFFKSCKAVKRLEFAGSYRRGKETVGDLDILIDTDDGETVMDHLTEFPDITKVIARGETKISVRLEQSFQVDLRVVPKKSFGAALQYFTGSKEHNVELRGRAKSAGLRINEYGVYDTSGKKEKYIAGETEADVYATLGLPEFAPELREQRGEFEMAENDALPDLIELSHIRGDLHMHTTATDGKYSIEEMAAAAKERGLKYIAITDHSKRVAMANGLDGKRAKAQWKKIDEINEQSDGKFWIFKGIECDILEAGGMDLSDKILEQADWVLAAIHYGQNQSREQITDRLIGAIENPHVDAVAHPTGRLLNRREPYEVDMSAVMSAVKENNKILELNANPARLDLNDVHVAQAKAQKIPIVINTDAHSINGLDVMQYGIKQARRGGLTKADVVNCATLAKFKKLIGIN